MSDDNDDVFHEIERENTRLRAEMTTLQQSRENWMAEAKHHEAINAQLHAKYKSADQAYKCAMAIHGTVMEERDQLRARVAELADLLRTMVDVAGKCDETGYAEGVGFVDLPSLRDKARAAIDEKKGAKL